MRNDDRVEERIDAALCSYVDRVEVLGTPIAVARVMARVRSESRARRIAWWRFAAAVASSVMAIIFAAWMDRGSPVQKIAWMPKAPAVARVPGPSGLSKLPDHAARKVAHTAGATGLLTAQQGLPKLEVFPAPRPLSAQEKSLLAFAEKSTPEQTNQVVEEAKHLADPIAIAELKIAPLVSSEQQDFNENAKNKEK